MKIRRQKKSAEAVVKKKRQLPAWVTRRNCLIAAVGLAAFVLLAVLLRDDKSSSSTGGAVSPVVNPPGSSAPVESSASQAVTSPTATGNLPPSIERLQLPPDPIFPGMAIKVEPAFTDPEGDAVTAVYEWKRNGEVLPGQVMDELATSEFRKGDMITVSVTPTDARGAAGESRTSRQILIHNRPPEIVSTPPAGSSTGHFRYQVQATDPDNDTLSFSLEESPSGMTINSQSGLIEWNAPPGLSGKQQVRVTVTDRDAKAFQSFNLNLHGESPTGAAVQQR